MYKVLKAFTDLQDNNRVYHTGEIYPAKGVKVSDARIKELSGSENKIGCPLIAIVQDLNPDGEPAEKPKRNRKK